MNEIQERIMKTLKGTPPHPYVTAILVGVYGLILLEIIRILNHA